MTEDEAKSKWCPFARVPQWIVSDEDRRTPIAACNTGVSGERDGDGVSCIASACMAWRWAWEEQDYVARQMNLPMDRSTTEGGCGLAGAPQ